MPPKLVTDKGNHIVIRPLAYAMEKDIARYARGMELPLISCNLCGSQENMQRKNIKKCSPHGSWNILGAARTSSPRCKTLNRHTCWIAASSISKNLQMGDKVAEGDVVFDEE